MSTPIRLLGILCGVCVSQAMGADETADVSARYRALRCPPPVAASTWAIRDRDGANRQVEPYLSSLAQGESGIGTMASPLFVLDVDEIRFTICGHDGPSGGQNENFIALVDARKGEALRKTVAPGNDALQERAWDVRDLRGKQVRIEVSDGDRGGAFAWLGVGQIDAGAALRVDFRQGLPEGWQQSERVVEVRREYVPGTIPFERHVTHQGVIPDKGEVALPCGFRARRLYFLGCTVPAGVPLGTYGAIELHYQTGVVDIVPLVCGFTLEGRGKLLSPSPAMHLAASRDPFEYVLAIAPADEVIEMIRLVANPGRNPIPRISAITCETTADSEHLAPLPREEADTDVSAWLDAHAVSRAAPDRLAIEQQLRQSHRLSVPDEGTPIRFAVHQIDAAFRSEGVAVADFNGDGQLDIAAGHVVYTGPDWKIQPLLGEAQAFPWKGYSDAFLCFDDDIDRDGAQDLIVVGFPGQQTYWLANPGPRGGTWQKHLAIEQTGNESPAYEDVDGDGQRELVFLHGSRCALARPGQDVTAPWQITDIAGPQDPGEGHGLGVGDVNGDGKLDVLGPAGWWEQPSTAGTLPWPFHAAPFYGGAQLCVWDFDEDGDREVLGSSPHAYGIGWTKNTADGWKTTMIDQEDSQTHAIHLADINRDGLMDFVTGKRFWAHNGHDPGSFEPAVLCWYELQRAEGQLRWIKHRIHHDSGVGLHFRIVDLNGDGLLDIVTSNKKGVYCFEQLVR
ncbi:MAG: VCBS repeat-containing protein [Pirellulaceae bacterium]|jgi:hypothetical protein|nr:VCBS repeat-containing protein [Pirellulaceae bacterium]